MSTPSRPRAFHLIAQQIRDDILRGRRKPGDRLPPEHVLAEQFHVSRAGVREAVRVLESQGLVQVRHGYAGGVFVADVGLTPVLGALETSLQLGQLQVNEVYEARVLFEPVIARLAVERGDPAIIAQLEENVNRTKAMLETGLDVFAANLEFHAILARAVGNRVFALVMQALLELLQRLDREYPTNRGVSRKAVHDHSHLLAAVQARDPARAEQLMVEHLRDLEGRFARIQQQMLRTRAAGVEPIPAWGGLHFDPAEARADAEEAPRDDKSRYRSTPRQSDRVAERRGPRVQRG